MISKNTAQQIVDTVKDVCGYDINYISTDGIITASTDQKRIGDYHEIGRKAAQSGQTLEVYDNVTFEGAQKGVNIPFNYHGQTLAVIGITGEPDEVRRYARLALRIMRMLLRERDLDASRELKRAEFSYVARAMVNNESLNFEYVQDFLHQKGLDLHEKGRAVIIRLQIEDRTRNITYYENRSESVLSGIPQSLYAYDYPDRFILICSEKSFAENRERIRQMCELPASVAAGSLHSLNHIHRSYTDAQLALNSAAGAYTEFDSLGIELLFSGLSGYVRERFLARTLSKLDQADLDLLSVYFENNLSLKQTSEELFIHKNTLQYRLERIRKVSGLDPRNVNDAAVLIAALKLKNTMVQEIQ
ncbi:MAG: helix-turn-helix domain-containing protein [Solobacterium sp.]|nr:helix-turn-helix domain-containing protein [Solobacterium sp.]